MSMMWGLKQLGVWKEQHGTNVLDTGAPFYDTYETKDGKFVSVGSIEPQFYELLLEKTGLKGESLPAQMDRKAWAQLKSRMEHIFRTKTRDEWCAIMEGTDICFAPVLTMKEASQHPHAKARGAYVDVSGFPQPAAAPRFSRTKEGIKGPAAKRGQHTDEILGEKGFSAKEIGELKAAGIVGPQ
jgi:alpha-methylacyl-CoA racemase